MKHSQNILIIEDEKTLAHALEQKLTRAGFLVSVAFNGEDGIALLEKNSFDLILLDLIMPKVDGFAVLSALCRKHDTTPVMVLTNLSQEEDMRRAREFGAKEFFIKSNTPIATIVERVEKLVS
jgi:DNA-binding response OmpR family regulator